MASGHGGARAGSGRKPGTATTRTREIAEKAAAEGLTPLEYLIQLMRKPYPEGAKAPIIAQYDSMRFEAAKAAAPYMHPRLSQTDSPIHLEDFTGTPTELADKVMRELAAGELTPDQANTIMQAIGTQIRILEVDELERRVKELEGRAKTR